MKVGEIDGGSPRSLSGAESSKKGLLEGIPVVAFDAAALRASNQRRALLRRALQTNAMVWLAVQAEAMQEREMRWIHCSAMN